MLQCVYFASIYGELLRYKLSFANSQLKSNEVSQINEQDPSPKQSARDLSSPLKVGIIGCG
jgi:hypothetical protein